MAKKPEITLPQVQRNLPKKQTEKAMQTSFRASDLMDADRLAKMRAEARNKPTKKELFDWIDALGAEIIARFGFAVYRMWNEGEIETEQMVRWVKAERAREKENLADLEAVIIAMVGSCIRRGKKDPKPKGLGVANKIYKRHIKQAKGEE